MRRIEGLDDALLNQVQKSAAPRTVWRALVALESDRALDGQRSRLIIRLGLGRSVTRLPEAVAQLLKLSLDPALSSLFAIEHHVHEPAHESALALGLDQVWVSWPQQASLVPWLWEALNALLPSGLVPLVERLAFSAAVHETLRLIMNHMLSTDMLEEVFSLMLSGLTSGYGLGFNRAVLFLWDPSARCFIGHRAMGPDNQAQAHQIWEQLELEEMSVETLLEVSQPELGQERTALESRARAITLGLDDPLMLLQAQEPSNPHCARRSLAQLGSPSALDVLDPAPELILARVGSLARPLGLIFADNRYNQLPIDPDHLSHLSFFLDQSALIWERLKARALIAYQAEHDPLTGALNRRAFERRLDEHLERELPFAIALIDVDRFKFINDHYGHAEGDRRLVAVAQQLGSGLGGRGVLARYGGDEFVLLLSVWSDAQRELLITLCRELAQRDSISLSVGMALRPSPARAPSSISAQRLMLQADARLYEAKRQGRGRVVFDDGQTVSFAQD